MPVTRIAGLTAHVLPGAKIEPLVQVLRRFDELPDARDLVSYL
jgi:hypothetical protein